MWDETIRRIGGAGRTGPARLAAGELLEQAGRSSRPSSSPPRPPVTGHWHGIFDEEFGPVRWTRRCGRPVGSAPGSRPDQPDDELSCYDPAEVTQANGILDSASSRGGDLSDGRRMIAKPYATGFISTRGRFSFTHGFLEARSGCLPPRRARSPIGPPSGPSDEGGGRRAGRGRGARRSGVLAFPRTGRVTGNCSAATFAGGWHTFGADWSGQRHLVLRRAARRQRLSGITSSPLFLILDLSVDHANGGPIEAPRTCESTTSGSGSTERG